VWLAFFLHDVLAQFTILADRRGDAFAAICRAHAAGLAASLAEHGWDGAWYRRAYFDDGTPLGSAENTACQLDALPQSWAILSGVGDPARARAGLAAVDARLVDRRLGVIKLFDPPFGVEAAATLIATPVATPTDAPTATAIAERDPGYVRGYVPGVRENGGQYTHAAIWTVMAFAADGQAERAWELFGLINPIRHGDAAAAIETYRVEPYVVAADVYTNPQHAGRGGWTWYTGSAAWMYRLIVESLLGLRLDVDRLHVTPLLPAGWPGFDVHYRYRETMHHIHVHNRGGGGRVIARVECDGVDRPDHTIALSDDRKEHWATVEVGS
jgi:cellobiose phosphorylase